jgi:hypothetical protein
VGRAGLAILSIECDETTPGRVLIRIKTIDDTLAGGKPVDRPFADPQAALDHLGEWIARWTANPSSP